MSTYPGLGAFLIGVPLLPFKTSRVYAKFEESALVVTHDSFYAVVVLKSLLRGQLLAKALPLTDNGSRGPLLLLTVIELLIAGRFSEHSQ